MIKKLTLSLFLLIIISNIAISQTKEAYNIKLNVKGLQDSTCYLAHFYLNTKSQIIKDTAVCDKKGNILFAGNTELPKGIYIISIGRSNTVQLIVGDQFFEASTDTTYRTENMKILRGNENKLFYEYQNEMALKTIEYRKLGENSKAAMTPQIEKQLKLMQKDILKYQTLFFEKNKNTSMAKLLQAPMQPTIPDAPKLANGAIDSTFALRWIQRHYFDNLDLSDEMYIKTPYLESKIDYYLENLTYQIPDSLNKAADYIVAKAKTTKTMQKYLSSHIANKYERPSFMGGDAVFVHMAEKYFIGMPQLWDSSTIAPVTQKKIALKNVMIGSKVQNAQLTDTTGTKIVALHDVKAKYTLVFLYDPECGHCKERAPKILAFSEKMKKYNLKVYAASTERDVEKIKKFIKTMKTDSFINVFDNLTITDFKMKFNTYTTPQVLLLNSNKIIIGRGIEEDQMEDLIMKIEKANERK
jgi:thiol-disulfide isomerase/thioredoxin